MASKYPLLLDIIHFASLDFFHAGHIFREANHPADKLASVRVNADFEATTLMKQEVGALLLADAYGVLFVRE